MVSLPKIQTLSRAMGGAGQTCQMRSLGSRYEKPDRDPNCLSEVQSLRQPSMHDFLSNLSHALRPLYKFLLNSSNPDAQHSTSLLFHNRHTTQVLRVKARLHTVAVSGARERTDCQNERELCAKGVSQRPTLFSGVLHINANY